MRKHSKITSALGFSVIMLGTLLGGAQAAQEEAPGATGELRLEKFGAPQSSFHVLSTLIIGPTEMVLWDAQYQVSQGQLLADRVAATGTRLKAIVLSHADHDHYMGAMEVVRRFPGTPVYMTEAGLADFNRRSQDDLEYERRRSNPEAPDKLVSPQVLPSATLTVDGHELHVIAGLTGDVRGSASSAMWIPSLRAVLTGDLAFDGIHPWLGDSDMASRSAWHESLDRLAALDPVVVIPGHKRDLTAPDSPHVLDHMHGYLRRYDELMSKAAEADEVVNAMVEAYPDLALPGLMAYGARRWFKK